MFFEARELRELTTAECLEHLSATRMGRVVFTTGALPAIVPVTYLLHEDSLLIATAGDSRLAAAANGSVLAFEIDAVDESARTGWSVVVTGVAEVLSGPAARAMAASEVAPWLPERAEKLIRVPCTRITGRHIAIASAQDA